MSKSAFPNSQTLNGFIERGMTLRDYFAGQALVGALAGRPPSNTYPLEQVAEKSYAMADAMLEARGWTA